MDTGRLCAIGARITQSAMNGETLASKGKPIGGWFSEGNIEKTTRLAKATIRNDYSFEPFFEHLKILSPSSDAPGQFEFILNYLMKIRNLEISESAAKKLIDRLFDNAKKYNRALTASLTASQRSESFLNFVHAHMKAWSDQDNDIKYSKIYDALWTKFRSELIPVITETMPNRRWIKTFITMFGPNLDLSEVKYIVRSPSANEFTGTEEELRRYDTFIGVMKDVNMFDGYVEHNLSEWEKHSEERLRLERNLIITRDALRSDRSGGDFKGDIQRELTEKFRGMAEGFLGRLKKKVQIETRDKYNPNEFGLEYIVRVPDKYNANKRDPIFWDLMDYNSGLDALSWAERGADGADLEGRELPWGERPNHYELNKKYRLVYDKDNDEVHNERGTSSAWSYAKKQKQSFIPG